MKSFLLDMKIRDLFLIIVTCLTIPAQYLHAQIEQESYPAWEEGQMEIHHINTASGECVFCIFPDGTNMIIDAGDLGTQRDPVHTTTLPNDSKQAGEWIGRYISRLISYRSEK